MPEVIRPATTHNASRISRKQGQRDEHQNDSHKTVPEEDVGPLRVGLRVVVPDSDPDAIGQGWNNHVRDVLVYGFGNIHHLLALGPVDFHENRRPALVPQDQVGILEGITHSGDISEAHDCAVFSGYDDDVLEVELVVALSDGPDADLGVLRIDAAGRKVEGTAADGICDIVQCQPEGSQTDDRHFDRDLVVSRPGGLDLGHAGQRPQVVFDLVGQFLQRALGDVAKDDQTDHAGAVVHLPELRTLGCAGKRLNASDRGLDLVHGLANVRTGLQFDSHRCEPRGRQGLYRLGILQRLDLLLDLDNDRLLHLLRHGAGIDYGHFDGIERNGRPGLTLQGPQRYQAGRQYDDH